MNILFIGDIVGPSGVAHVVNRLPDLRRELGLDCVIANAENAEITGVDPRAGSGMSNTTVDRLLAAGVDVITSGNHAWDQPDADVVLARSRVLRPHNLPPGRPGQGVAHLEIRGQPITVINLCDRLAIPDALPHYPVWVAADRRGAVIVDFHGGSATGKQTFALAIDGDAAAVLGTHTHEPTLPIHRCPGGTVLVVDVGMTGVYGGVGGLDPAHFVAELRGEPPVRTAVRAPDGSVTLSAVLLTLDGNHVARIQRVD